MKNDRKLKGADRRESGNRSEETVSIGQQIAEIEILLDRHWALYDEADIKKSRKARRKWTDAIVALSEMPARSEAEAFTKVEYLRSAAQLCLLPLALQGIVTDECFKVMRNMVADIKAWGLPLPRDARH